MHPALAATNGVHRFLCVDGKTVWCGNRELHPDDLLGRQTCWLLNITAAEIGVRPG